MSRNGKRARLLIALALPSSSVGCSEELPPIRYETEQALIGTSYDDPLCGWDFTAIDSHIAFVEDALDAQSDEKIEIYLFRYSNLPCNGLGCYSSDGYIKATWDSLQHEVVHAVVDRFTDPPLFLSEGIADALTDDGTRLGYLTVAEALEARSSADLDYATAGHFVRWLIEERGDLADVRELLIRHDPEPIYGAAFPELGDDYEATAPYYYPGWHPCNEPALAMVDDGYWSETMQADCGRADVTQFSEATLSLLRSVALEGGRYELRVTGGKGARLLGCETEPLDAAPTDMAFGDTNSAAEFLGTARGILFESGTLHTLDLVEGDYRIDIPVFIEGETVEIEIRRIGPRRD